MAKHVDFQNHPIQIQVLNDPSHVRVEEDDLVIVDLIGLDSYLDFQIDRYADCNHEQIDFFFWEQLIYIGGK